MKGYNLEETMNLRSLDRSPYRNMPEKCLRCAYASKPSTLGAVCNMCPAEHQKKENK
jgi:hypothetical protein